MPAGTGDLPWLDRLRGRFIVFDGPDGSGKTTQFRRFAECCTAAGLDPCCVREPGGTTVGEAIRAILLDRGQRMGARCEMLLYMASRAQLVEEQIRPAREAGRLVLADRYISSTLAYQGAGHGLPADEILAVGRVATLGCMPDLVVIFDVDARTAHRRLAGDRTPRGRGHGGELLGRTLFSDRMERNGQDFWERVRRGFLDQARHHPEHHVVIDARAGEDAVFDALLSTLRQRLA